MSAAVAVDAPVCVVCGDIPLAPCFGCSRNFCVSHSSELHKLTCNHEFCNSCIGEHEERCAHDCDGFHARDTCCEVDYGSEGPPSIHVPTTACNADEGVVETTRIYVAENVTNALSEDAAGQAETYGREQVTHDIAAADGVSVAFAVLSQEIYSGLAWRNLIHNEANDLPDPFRCVAILKVLIDVTNICGDAAALNLNRPEYYTPIRPDDLPDLESIRVIASTLGAEYSEAIVMYFTDDSGGLDEFKMGMFWRNELVTE